MFDETRIVDPFNHPGYSDHILSDEGSTQGDVAAKAMYAIGIRSLIDKLNNDMERKTCSQVWYADDSSCAGKLLETRKWWETLNMSNPKFGYFPKPSKSVFLVKDLDKLDQARETFSSTEIKITTAGDRHLGAVIGSDEFREEYIRNKIENWISDIEQLSNIEKDEPQLVYSAFTKAMCMRWSYLQRNIPNISHHFEPLEDAIKDK